MLLSLIAYVGFLNFAHANQSFSDEVLIHGNHAQHREYTEEDAELVPVAPSLQGQRVVTPKMNSSLVAAGKEVARIATAQAYQKLKNELVLKVFAAIPGTPVVWPQAGYDYKACGSNTLAFVIRGLKKIHICRGVMDLGVSSAWMGQLIIHEMAHIIGLFDECNATVIEVVSMMYSSYGLQFKNGYYSRCIGN